MDIRAFASRDLHRTHYAAEKDNPQCGKKRTESTVIIVFPFNYRILIRLRTQINRRNAFLKTAYRASAAEICPCNSRINPNLLLKSVQRFKLFDIADFFNETYRHRKSVNILVIVKNMRFYRAFCSPTVGFVPMFVQAGIMSPLTRAMLTYTPSAGITRAESGSIFAVG